MILFWLIAALLSGGATVLILARAAGRREAAADPSLEVYRRQLTEIDDLAERGLLGPEEQRSAHAEAGRRLLRAAEEAPKAPVTPTLGRTGRRTAGRSCSALRKERVAEQAGAAEADHERAAGLEEFAARKQGRGNQFRGVHRATSAFASSFAACSTPLAIRAAR